MLNENILNRLGIVVRVAGRGRRICTDDLELIEIMYDLSDEEKDEMRSYCLSHGLEIVEPPHLSSDEIETLDCEKSMKHEISPEKAQANNNIETVTKYIMHIAMTRAEERAPKGWICGYNMIRIESRVSNAVFHSFTNPEIEKICALINEGDTRPTDEHNRELMRRVEKLIPPIMLRENKLTNYN